MSFGIGFGLVHCIPPGVVGFDGGDTESPPVTAVVSGNTFDVPTSVDESIIVLLGGWHSSSHRLPPSASQSCYSPY
jgi:hypothetical protein